jgi:glutathione S-transferase
MSEYQISYWGLKGLAEPLIQCAKHVGLNLKVNRYGMEDRPKWMEEKEKMLAHNDFPNLPYIRKGDFVMTESSAIMMYICFEGMRYDLIGSTP